MFTLSKNGISENSNNMVKHFRAIVVPAFALAPAHCECASFREDDSSAIAERLTQQLTWAGCISVDSLTTAFAEKFTILLATPFPHRKSSSLLEMVSFYLREQKLKREIGDNKKIY